VKLLELSGLRAGYAGSVVLDGVDLAVEEGEVVALLGINGAGKSTTMRVIAGLHAPSGGRVLFAGVDITHSPAHKRSAAGLCLSPEGRLVFPHLSVEDNLSLGSYGARVRRQRAASLEQVYALFPILKARRKQNAGLLSGGEQQMLAMGRALMGRPRLLMLDEPSFGLAPLVLEALFNSIREIARSGISILLVEQNVQAALGVAERGYVLAQGRITLSVSAEELSSSSSLRNIFLHQVEEVTVPGPVASEARATVAEDATKAEPILRIRDLRLSFGGLVATNNLSLEVKRHQFVGVIGPNGAGKTTLLNLITGYLRPNSGQIYLSGERVDGLRPYDICVRGVSRTFQIVQSFPEMSVIDNVLTGALFSRRARISLEEARERVRRPLELVGLHHKTEVIAGTLALADLKKLELARALASQPELLLLDEVMAGSPHGDVLELMEVLGAIHAAGTTILMIEHLVHVILGLAQHIVVLNFGEKLFEGSPAEVVADQRVIETYFGTPVAQDAGVHGEAKPAAHA